MGVTPEMGVKVSLMPWSLAAGANEKRCICSNFDQMEGPYHIVTRNK